MTLEWIDQELAICRLNPGAACPAWALASAFMSITRTDAELSIIGISEQPNATARDRIACVCAA